MKGYHGWCELRAKIVAIMKTKMQLILGKKTPWKRTNLQKMNVSKTWGNHSHSKVRENALTLTLKGFLLFAHWRGSQKYKTVSFRPDCFSYAIQEKFTRQAVNFSMKWTLSIRLSDSDLVIIARTPHPVCWRSGFLFYRWIKWTWTDSRRLVVLVSRKTFNETSGQGKKHFTTENNSVRVSRRIHC